MVIPDKDVNEIPNTNILRNYFSTPKILASNLGTKKQAKTAPTMILTFVSFNQKQKIVVAKHNTTFKTSYIPTDITFTTFATLTGSINFLILSTILIISLLFSPI